MYSYVRTQAAGNSCTAAAQGAQAEDAVEQLFIKKRNVQNVQNVQDQQINAESTANSQCIVNLHYHSSPTFTSSNILFL